jgi:hypothetical protein
MAFNMANTIIIRMMIHCQKQINLPEHSLGVYLKQ